MDCQSALELLDCVRPGSADLQEPEFAAARTHLDHCAACAAEFSRRQRFDSALVDLMVDVPAPPELLARLEAGVIDSELTSATAAPQAPSEDASRVDTSFDQMTTTSTTAMAKDQSVRIRRRRSLLALSLCVMVVGLGSWWWLDQPRQFAVQDLLQQLKVDSLPHADAFDESFVAVNPAHWNHSRLLPGKTVRGMNLDHRAGHDVALLSFRFDTRRGQTMTGVLAAIPAARVFDVPSATSFTHAEPQYFSQGSQRFVAAVWREQDQVYLCLISGSAAELEQLQDALRGTAI